MNARSAGAADADDEMIYSKENRIWRPDEIERKKERSDVNSFPRSEQKPVRETREGNSSGAYFACTVP